MDALQSVELVFTAYLLLLKLDVLEVESGVYVRKEEKSERLAKLKILALKMEDLLAELEKHHVTLVENSFEKASSLIMDTMNNAALFQSETFAKREVLKLAGNRKAHIRGVMHGLSESEEKQVQNTRERFKKMNICLRDMTHQIQALEQKFNP